MKRAMLAVAILLTACRGDHLIGAVAGPVDGSSSDGGSSSADGSAGPVDAASGPTPRITGVTANGSGCAAGTATAQIAADGGSFDVAYPASFAVQYDTGSAASDSRKSCQLLVQLDVPAGYTYALASVDYHGTVALVAGATAQLTTSYYVAGESATGRIEQPFTGPMQQDLQAHVAPDPASIVWAACGASSTLVIESSLTVGQGSAPDGSHGALSLDKARTFRLQLMPCQP